MQDRQHQQLEELTAATLISLSAVSLCPGSQTGWALVSLLAVCSLSADLVDEYISALAHLETLNHSCSPEGSVFRLCCVSEDRAVKEYGLALAKEGGWLRAAWALAARPVTPFSQGGDAGGKARRRLSST